MADLSNIFAGMLGGAAQGFAEGESSRIQLLHRAQAQIMISDAEAKRKASLSAIAHQNDNAAWNTRLDSLTPEDESMLQDRYGENWRTHLTLSGEDRGDLLMDAITREPGEETKPLPDSAVSKMSEFLNMPEEDIRNLPPNMQSSAFNVLTSAASARNRLKEGEGGDALVNTVATATKDLDTFFNRMVTHRGQSDDPLPMVIAIANRRAYEIAQELRDQGSPVTPDLLEARVKAEYAEIAGPLTVGSGDPTVPQNAGPLAYIQRYGDVNFNTTPPPEDSPEESGGQELEDVLTEGEVNEAVPEGGISIPQAYNVEVDPALNLEEISPTRPSPAMSAVHENITRQYSQMDDRTYKSSAHALMQRAGVVGMITNSTAQGPDKYKLVIEALRDDGAYYRRLTAVAQAKGMTLEQLIRELYG